MDSIEGSLEAERFVIDLQYIPRVRGGDPENG